MSLQDVQEDSVTELFLAQERPSVSQEKGLSAKDACGTYLQSGLKLDLNMLSTPRARCNLDAVAATAHAAGVDFLNADFAGDAERWAATNHHQGGLSLGLQMGEGHFR